MKSYLFIFTLLVLSIFGNQVYCAGDYENSKIRRNTISDDFNELGEHPSLLDRIELSREQRQQRIQEESNVKDNVYLKRSRVSKMRKI
ncbi:hypothetical protein BDF14DRAFT_1860335 [Spinellus fusiger]|nr:hypothetical protein BDF14DRAFT_1860335 [Spinellus fusiger]